MHYCLLHLYSSMILNLWSYNLHRLIPTLCSNVRIIWKNYQHLFITDSPSLSLIASSLWKNIINACTKNKKTITYKQSWHGYEKFWGYACVLLINLTTKEGDKIKRSWIEVNHIFTLELSGNRCGDGKILWKKIEAKSRNIYPYHAWTQTLAAI